MARNFVAAKEEYADRTLNDWLADIAADVMLNNSGYISIGVTAITMFNEFMDWLKVDQGFSPGYTQDLSSTYSFYAYEDIYVNGVNTLIIMPSSNFSFNLGYSKTKVLLEGSPTIFYPGDSISPIRGNSSYSLYINDDFSINNSYSSLNNYSFTDAVENWGYSLSDIVGYVPIVYMSGSVTTYKYLALAPLMNDGYYLFYRSTQSKSIIGSQVSYNLSGYTSSVTADASVVVGSSGLSGFDMADWIAGSALVLNTGDLTGTSEEELKAAIDSGISTGTLSVAPELTLVDDPVGDDVLPDEGDGIISGTVSDILDYVKALPESIANSILTGVKSIFIPDPDGVQAAYMAFLEEVNDYYSFDFDLGSLFADAVAPDDITAVYAIGPLSWDLTFVSWYYLKSGVLYFRPYIRGFIVLMLIYYNLRQFMAIFGLGGVMNGSSGDAQSEAYVGRLMADYMSNYKG